MTAAAPLAGARESLPRPLPVLGHLPAFLSDRLGFLDRVASGAAGGDARAIELRIGERTLLLLDWADIRHVLVHRAARYDKTWRLTSARGRRLSGDGVLTRVGEAHLVQRRLLQPLFHPGVIRGLADGAVASAREVVSAWTDGGERDVRADMLAIARGAVFRLLFGPSFRDPDGRLARAVETRRRYFGFWFFTLFPWPELLPVAANREHRTALRHIDEAIRAAIAAERRAPQGGLLEGMLAARDADGAAMPDDLVRDEVRTLLVTGHETVAEALTWTWIELAQHPHVEARLHAEVDRVVADGGPEPADLERLPYTWMVLAEALRVRPPTWLFVRIAREDDVLPSGVPVRAGDKLYLSPWVVQRSPRYFPEPQRFDPERFHPHPGARGQPPGWFPFGAGPRVCLGEAFARAELVLVLAAIARRFRLELLPDADATPVPGITLHPRRAPRMRVVERRR